MITTILTHEVSDFVAWKKVFDADAPLREQTGIKIIGLYTATDNTGSVTIISEFPNEQFFREFMLNEEMKDKMKKAGVVSEPEIRVLNKV